MENKKKSATKKSAAPKLSDLNVKQRRQAILKQKHCDAVALHIVGKLIDAPVEADVFLHCLIYLNQSHFQDVVEERAISKLCGYPVCINTLPDMPAKKYHISSKQKKVYDITERKNYCSNFCYKAGIYIKEQMLTSPLWYRDREQIPTFHLLPETESGLPGQEVDQGVVRITPNETDIEFTSVAQFAQFSLNDIPNNAPQTSKTNFTNKESTSNVIANVSKEVKDDIKEENIKINDSESFSYSSIFTPSLADILKQNAVYFDDLEKSEALVTSPKPDLEPVQLKKSDSEPVQLKKSDSEKSSIKGILSKNKQKQKKKVSFSAVSENTNIKFENNVIEEPLQQQNNTKIFKKPVISERLVVQNEIVSKNLEQINKIVNDITDKLNISNKDVENNLNTSNVDVQNISLDSFENKTEEMIDILHFNKGVTPLNDIKKHHLERNELTNKISKIEDKLEKIVTQNENSLSINVTDIQRNLNEDEIKIEHKKHISEDSLINKPVVEHKTFNVSEKLVMRENDMGKEKRLSNIKNSATFAKASRLSKSQIKAECDRSNSCIKTRLKKCLQNWFTFETMIFLYGEERIKKIVSDKTFKQYLNIKKNSKQDDMKRKQYESICKRLNLMELTDTKFDESFKENEKNPLPRYDNLKEQAESMDIRVQAFYSGCYEVHEIEDDSASIKDEDKEYTDEEIPAVLPLIDSKDLLPTRRKIFLMGLNRTMPTICAILQQSPNYLMSDLKQLVDTMEFDANNIVFKSSEWPLVTILLIKILSVRDKELKEVLDTQQSYEYITSLMKTFHIDNYHMDEFLLKTMDIHCFVQDYLRKSDV